MNISKWFLRLCDNNEKNILKAGIIIFFPLYLTGYLFFPTFRTLDFWTCLFLIAGIDILLNFMLMLLVRPLAKNNNELQYRIMTYASLFTITVSITAGIFAYFQTNILYFSTILTMIALLTVVFMFYYKDKKEKKKNPPKD